MEPLQGTKAERKYASLYVFGECCKRIFEVETETLRGHYYALRDDPTTYTAGVVPWHWGYRFPE